MNHLKPHCHIIADFWHLPYQQRILAAQQSEQICLATTHPRSQTSSAAQKLCARALQECGHNVWDRPGGPRLRTLYLNKWTFRHCHMGFGEHDIELHFNFLFAFPAYTTGAAELLPAPGWSIH